MPGIDFYFQGAGEPEMLHIPGLPEDFLVLYPLPVDKFAGGGCWFFDVKISQPQGSQIMKEVAPL